MFDARFYRNQTQFLEKARTFERAFVGLAESDISEFWLMPYPHGRYAGERVYGDIYWRMTMPPQGKEWWMAYQERQFADVIDPALRRG